MIPKAIDAIELQDLEALIGQVRESRRIEFKTKLPGKGEGDTVPFLAAVTAFANTGGGDLILGVAEDDGVASAITGLSVSSIDDLKLRLLHRLANCVEPRLPRVDIHSVSLGDDRHVVIVRAPKSLIGPHRVTLNGKFYARNSAGKYEMDVAELRSAFVMGESLAERIRSFRDDRVRRLHVGKTPVPTRWPGRVVLHFIPVQAFHDPHSVDFVAALRSGTHMPLPLSGPSSVNRRSYNLDGLVNVAQMHSAGAASYVQFFRSGIVEGVSALPRSSDQSRSLFAAEELTDTVCKAVAQYSRVIMSLEIGFPAFIFLSLCGDTSVMMRHVGPDGLWYEAGPLDDMPVLFPETRIDAEDDDIPARLRPVFDAVWNAFGFERCYRYNDQGIWQGSRP